MISLCSFLLLVSGCDDSAAVLEESSETEMQTEQVLEGTSPETVTQAESTEDEALYVHVCGAVRSPGVYMLPAGARAQTAVEAAGGLSEDAEEKAVNLAQELTDGMQLYVPAKGETQAAASGGAQDTGALGTQDTGTGGASENTSRININTASAQELTALSGIGDSKAAAIVDYREKNGFFTSIEDIKNVSGIGDGTFEKIKEDITV